MITGNKLWKDSHTQGLIKKKLSDGRQLDFYEDVPESLYEALQLTAGKRPLAPVITDNYGRTYNYGEFLQHCDRLSEFLNVQKKITKGTHVGLLMYNCYEFCVAFFALNRLGAVIVPLPGKFKQMEVLQLADRADVELVICDRDYEDWFADSHWTHRIISIGNIEEGYGYDSVFRAVSWTPADNFTFFPKSEPESPAIIMFTSGTTSDSKGVVLCNYNIMHAVEVYRRTLGITSNDISVIATPIYHITGLIALLGLFVLTGAHLYLHKFFDAFRVIDEARKYNFTFLHASPTVFNLLIQAGENSPEIPSLQSFACGSSNMAKDKLLRLHKWLPASKFHTVYGLTETSSPATIFPDDAASSKYIGSSGLPIPGTIFKIMDDDGNELSNGSVGEILVSGTVLLHHYYKQKKGDVENGWLHTGDLGYFNEEGYLYVVDRKKNMINRGGEKIWCYDLENEISSIVGVQDVAVVGIPDELYGEVPAALIVPSGRTSVLPESIQNYLRGRIATYKIPVKIRLTDEIPQTKGGKTDKLKIRELLMKD